MRLPWTIKRKLPNGVNFEISNTTSSETKVVHHNRLTSVKDPANVIQKEPKPTLIKNTPIIADGDHSGSDSSSESEVESDGSSVSEDIEEPTRRYTARERTQRQIAGAIPWDQIPPI